MLATNDSQSPMGRLLATAQSGLRFYSHPGTLFLTLTYATMSSIIGHYHQSNTPLYLSFNLWLRTV